MSFLMIARPILLALSAFVVGMYFTDLLRGDCNSVKWALFILNSFCAILWIIIICVAPVVS